MVDIEAESFVDLAVSGAIYEQYHIYDMYFAPLIAAWTKAKHC